jgi:hypothetical protein
MVIGRTQTVVDGLLLGPDWCPIVDQAAETGAPFGESCAPIDLRGKAWSDEYINLVRPLLANM